MVLLLLGLFVASGASFAQQPVRIGVASFPPSVIVSPSGEPEGFDIELWQAMARDADLQYEFEVLPLVDLLVAVEAGAVDAGMAGISVRGDREERMDFSHPYMLAGVRILTTMDDRPRLLRYLQSAVDSGAARALSYLVGFIVFCAHILYLAERGSKSVSREYFPGIFESAWFIVATMTTVGYGDVTPHRWLGRFVAFVVMVTGIGLFGVLIADLSSGMTLQEAQARLSGPEDLTGRRVVTVAGSTSVDIARSHGAFIAETDDLEAAITALLGGEADAVVFDGPPLLQYVRTHPAEALVVVAPRLTTESYAVAFPTGSPLRETVNRALLALRESGEQERLREKWFGAGP